jgi:hypothetical protein
MIQEPETQELAKQEKAPIDLKSAGMELKNLDDMWRAAQMFHSSGLVPDAMDSPQKIVVALQAGFELGFLPWQSLQSLYVVKGRVGLSGQAMLGLIRKNKTCEYIKTSFEGEEYKDDYRAVVTSKRRDEPIEHITTFSVDDAKRASLWEGMGKNRPKESPWHKHPKDMLTWRAVSRHTRLHYSDDITGFYTEEEIQEMVPSNVPLIGEAAEPGVAGLVKRVENQAQKAEPAPEQKAEEPKPKRGRPKKEKVDEAKPEASQEPAQDAPEQAVPETAEPAAAPTEAPTEPAPEPEPQPVVNKYKCNICKREFPEMKDEKCPYCFGKCTEL